MKIKNILLFILLFIYKQYINAQNNFTHPAIPDSLKNNTNAVYILDEGVLEVKSANTYTFKNHQIIHVLNRAGLFHLTQTFGINKFYNVENVQIKIYDSVGKEIKKYKKKDFSIQAYNDETTLLSDYKTLYLQAFSPSIPFTIEIESEENATSFIELPDWTICAPEESVLKSVFTIKTTSDMDIRYNVKNIQLPPPVISNENRYKTYKWEINNIKAEKYESNSYETSNYLPKIQIAPKLFEYDGYKGSFNNWQDFGAWNYSLYEDNPFSPQRVTEILNLVKNDDTETEKIKTLYNYLQNNMRYVSIQLGIGGFKPFAVDFVDNKKYGDCKALTNYMRYILKVAGIKSYPALINAGYNKLPADISFPTDIFNHVILCIPLKNDTIWLECTGKYNECGILGSFTENKKALLLTEKGGILINTPSSDYRNNIFASKSIINLDEEGSGVTNTSFFYKGEFNIFFKYLMQQQYKEQKTWLLQNLYFKHPDELEINNSFSNENTFTTNAGYEQLFNFKSGSKYFFPSKIFKFTEDFIKQSEARKSPYIFNYPYKKVDTTIYNLGKYFTAENIPAKKSIQNDYAKYEQDVYYNSNDSTITIVTSFILKHHIVPPKGYKELTTFFNEMNQLESSKIILKKL